MNELLIIKDPEDQIFYATIKDDHDGDHERTIIAQGDSELEALQKGVNKVLKAYTICKDRLRLIGESLCNPRDFYLEDKFFTERYKVNRPTEIGDFGQIAESFDAMSYDEELKLWCRFYR